MITEKEIMHIAKLSMLKLEENEIPQLSKDMNNIVKMVDNLQNLDLDSTYNSYAAEDKYNAFRQDEIKPSYDKEEILKNAPDKKAGCFFVPMIVD